MSETKQVHIVTVHYNSPQDILECWQSLSQSEYDNYTWYILDNASSESSLHELKQKLASINAPYSAIASSELKKDALVKQHKIHLIEHAKNDGFAAGNNVVLEYLIKNFEDDMVWLLNPDVVLEAAVLRDLVQRSQQHPKALIGNLIHYYNTPSKVMYCGGFYVKKWSHGVCDVKEISQLTKVDAIAGASLFARVAAFKELGVLPEHYFLYWEETHFCTLAKRKGFDFIVNASSKIFDKVGSAANTSFTREYLYLLNGLRYYHTFYPWRMPVIVLSTIAKLVKAIFTGPSIKRTAIYYGHIDYFKWFFGVKIDVKKRIAQH